jgi:serine/threonine protein kinase
MPKDSSALVAGRYLLGDGLGKGGAASVYRAFDQRLKVECAIKILSRHREGLQNSLRRRLLAEARIMAKLRHPNVLPVTDVGQHDGRDFIVMALAEGGSLADALRRDGPLPPGRVVEVGLQLLSALEAAHEAGVIHRDVKPQNLLLTADGRVQLADFGIALIEDPEEQRRTRTGVAMGSMAFMAPEQRIDAARVTPAADVYAVASTMYTLLTNHSPMDLFVADGTSGRWDHVPRGLLPVLMRATRYAPTDRFESAAEMAVELRRCGQLLDHDGDWEASGEGATPGAPSWLSHHGTGPVPSSGAVEPTVTDVDSARSNPPPAETPAAPPEAANGSPLTKPSLADEPTARGVPGSWVAGAVLAALLVGGVVATRVGGPVPESTPVAVRPERPEPVPSPAASPDSGPRDRAESKSIPPVEPAPVAPEDAVADALPPEPPPARSPASTKTVPSPAPTATPGPRNTADAAPQSHGPSEQPLPSDLAPPAGQWMLNVGGRPIWLRLVVDGARVKGTLTSRLGEAEVRTLVAGGWDPDARKLTVSETTPPEGSAAAKYDLTLDASGTSVARGTLVYGREMLPVTGRRDPETDW